EIAHEWARDPLPKLEHYLVPTVMTDREWQEIAANARRQAEEAIETALALPPPDPADVLTHVFAEGENALQRQGGLRPLGHVFPKSTETPEPEANRINMVTAIRRTLDVE